MERASEDSESGLSCHVGPSLKRVCLLAQRKILMFSCKEDLRFYLYYSPTSWGPGYRLLPAYEDFLLYHCKIDPVIEPDSKVESAEEDLAKAKYCH